MKYLIFLIVGMSRKLTLFGVTMYLRHWILFFIFIIMAVIGILIMILYSSPIVYDLIGSTVSIVSILLAALTFIYSASRAQVDELRREFSEYRG